MMDLTRLQSIFQYKFKRFIPGEQHDVQECILCIIDILEGEINIIRRLFYGAKMQEIVFPTGSKKIPEDFSLYILPVGKEKCLKTLMDRSVRWNVVENYVDDANTKHNLATTRTYITDIPQILMISFDSKSHVTLEEELDITPYLSPGHPKTKYKLFASAVHVGVQYGGHYACLIKQGGKWFLHDDEKITPVDFPKEYGHYLLFYKQKNQT